MRRGLWIIFGLCVSVGFAAMGWISLTVLRLDRQAQVEENMRLALWRMDSALSPLIAQETARPYFAYSPFIRTQRAYNKAYSEVEVMIPSGGIRDVQPGGFDRFELYGRGHRPLTMGLATTVRFYEILINPHEKIEPARIVVRTEPPKECCETRFHFLGASGQETISDTLPVPTPTVAAPK